MVIVELGAISASGALHKLLILSARPSAVSAFLFNAGATDMGNTSSSVVNDWLSANLTISLLI